MDSVQWSCICMLQIIIHKASTVLSLFLQAVTIYGLPARVRSDIGGKNTLVSQFLINHHERGPGCMITNQGVHNQRMELLWRGVFAEFTSCFHAFFYTLEESGLLDHSNEADVFALHIVYLDEIQRHLNQFREGWNHHRMRTCHNRTLMQQWLLGLHEHSAEHPNDSAVTGP